MQRDKIDRLDTLTTAISVGKVSREYLSKAVLLTDEAEKLAARERFQDAEDRLKRAGTFTQMAKEVITPALRQCMAASISSGRRSKARRVSIFSSTPTCGAPSATSSASFAGG